MKNIKDFDLKDLEIEFENIGEKWMRVFAIPFQWLVDVV